MMLDFFIFSFNEFTKCGPKPKREIMRTVNRGRRPTTRPVRRLPMKYFCQELHTCSCTHMGMGQYLLIPFLVGWTSIYQLFWCSLGVQGFDALLYMCIIYIYILLHHSLPELVFGIIQGTPVSSLCRHCAIHNHVQPLNVTWTPEMQTSRSKSLFGIPIFCSQLCWGLVEYEEGDELIRLPCPDLRVLRVLRVTL